MKIRYNTIHTKKGTIVILFLVLLILLTILFLIEEIKKQRPQKKVNEITHEEKIKVEKEKEIENCVPLPKKRQCGKIALIIDDVGWNPEIVSKITKLNVPLTLAILPDSPFGLKIAQQLSGRKNLEMILHVPLEPEVNSSSETRLMQGFLTISMSNEEINKKIDEYFEKFGPYITGVNHHMGSRFTTDKEKMEILLQKIKEKKLIYVDSLTAKESVGYLLAKDMGIPSTKRDIFIDGSSEHSEIANCLEKAAKIASQKGMVVAIGHARTSTFTVLEQKIPELKEQGYQFLLISQVIKQ